MERWEAFEALTGKTLAGIVLEDDKTKMVVILSDGSRWTFRVEGECCSHSWIEHLETPGDVAGAMLTGMEDSDVVVQEHPEHECLQVYRTTFHTTKGDVTLEFRNSSNGYYGGYLEFEGVS